MSTRIRMTHSESLVPGTRRIWFHSHDLSAFVGSGCTDRYLKLIFPSEGQPIDRYDGLDLRRPSGTLARDEVPSVRTYTALYPDLAAGTLAIDFVIHGDEGVAGPWAAAAVPGEELIANGPGGAYIPDESADWHLLVADEAALPAVLGTLDQLSEDAVVRVVAMVEDADREPDLALALRRGAPASTRLTYAHRANGDSLAEAVRSLDWPAGRMHAFVHGEAEDVMRGVRPHLFRDRGLSRDQVSISGYWRRGRTEEGFREWKQAQVKLAPRS